MNHYNKNIYSFKNLEKKKKKKKKEIKDELGKEFVWSDHFRSLINESAPLLPLLPLHRRRHHRRAAKRAALAVEDDEPRVEAGLVVHVAALRQHPRLLPCFVLAQADRAVRLLLSSIPMPTAADHHHRHRLHELTATASGFGLSQRCWRRLYGYGCFCVFVAAAAPEILPEATPVLEVGDVEEEDEEAGDEVDGDGDDLGRRFALHVNVVSVGGFIL